MSSIKYTCAIISIFICSLADAQQWAGPDTTICQGAGAVLGSNAAPNDYCFNWSPADGLSSTTAKQPTAHPDKTTEYTLVAIGPNFSNKVVDKVKVTVATGGVVMAPSYTEPDGTANQSHAHLTSKEPGTTIIWSIVAPNHGCVINSSTGNISYCNSAGDVTVRATVQGNPDCYADGTFRVNVGVKQVFAIDNQHPTRKATEGQTLHLVGHNDVKFKAIPNDGESFMDDQPDWTGSTVLPPSPHDAEWIHDAGTPTTMNVTAGGKTANVQLHQASEGTVGGVLQTLNVLLTMLEDYVHPPDDMQSGYNFEENQTSVCSPFEGGIEPNLSYKESPAEKFNSPMLGVKKTIEGELAATITAKVCFPPPYSSVPNPTFVWSTYVSATGTAKLNAGISKDDAVAVNPTWQTDSLNFSGELKFTVGTQAGFFIPGDIFGAEAGLTGSIIVGLDPNFSSAGIKTKVKIEPLVIEGFLKVYYLNPDNTLINLSGKYNLLDPLEQEFNTVDFSQFH